MAATAGPTAANAPQFDEQGRRVWRVGTLVYTRARLIQVFTWLLLGDFCLHLMDNGVVPTLVPLQLEQMGASKTMIGLIYGTVVNLMYFVLVPIVSTWSDRARTPMGRRRPFLAVATPPLAICLILLGFSQHIARLLQGWMPGLLGDFGVMQIALTIACVLFLLVKFFDMFPQSVYYYMWADVIPPELMGTFGALFRVFYAGGSLIFNYFLIGLAKEHPEEIYIASALLYMIAFTLLVWQVKEGQYPPPEPATGPSDADFRLAPRGRVANFLALARGYFRDCFSMGFWWRYFLMLAAFQAGYQPFIANLVFLGREIFGDTEAGLKSYGGVLALRDLIWIGIYLALVPIMYKLHPMKAAVFGYVLMTATAGASFALVHDPLTFRVMTIATFVAVALYLGGTAALNARMLPREKFGQFASAGAMVFRLSVAVAAIGMGVLLDFTHSNRFVFLWFFVFNAIGLLLALWVYADWKRLGGEAGYTPPLPKSAPPAPAATIAERL